MIKLEEGEKTEDQGVKLTFELDQTILPKLDYKLAIQFSKFITKPGIVIQYDQS